MSKRKIIKIDEDKCNGCGLCANACHEGAIGMVNGKAKLLREDYCDGLGDCLPVCPTGAITFVEKEAPAYNEKAVKAAQNKKAKTDKRGEGHAAEGQNVPCGCPGTAVRDFSKKPKKPAESCDCNSAPPAAGWGRVQDFSLSNWPLQIKLCPTTAPFFDGADLVVAADCTAFAAGNIHELIKDKVVIIGCPKLDDGDYSEKLAEILSNNNIKSLTVIRMEVPCCGGLAWAAQQAVVKSGKQVNFNTIVINI